MKNAKKTVYLYVGIIVLIIMALMFVFQIINYNNTVETYVASGYEEAYVKEMLPFWGTLMPEFSSIITSYGLLVIVAFGINSILNAIKNEDYVEDFDAEDFLDAVADKIFDDEDDDDKKEAEKDELEDVIEDAVEKAVAEAVKNTGNK
ncbi:MAG: hypothetical protein E7218_00320 [Anaerofustis stercorihominis]|nr:hypothetical protein [Anaerofustis stercorihominis]